MSRPLLSAKAMDRLMSAVIRAGGVLVIGAVAAIVVDIALEALPLFRGARVGTLETVAGTGVEPVAVGTGPRGRVVWALGRDGLVRFSEGSELAPVVVPGGNAPVTAVDHGLHGLLGILRRDGTLVVGRVRLADRWDAAGVRHTTARWSPAAPPLALEGPGPWAGVAVGSDEEGDVAAVVWKDSGPATLWRYLADDEAWEPEGQVPPAPVRSAAVSDGLGMVALVDGEGGLHLHRLPGLAPLPVEGLPGAVSRVRFLIGGRSLVAAGPRGGIRVLLEVPRVRIRNGDAAPLRLRGIEIPPGGERVLPDDEIGAALASRPRVEVLPAAPEYRVVRTLPGAEAPVTVIAPAHRDRSFLVGTGEGTVGLYHATSGRRLRLDRWAEAPVHALAMAPRGNAVAAAAENRVLRRSLDNPHPGVSLRTLFLPVWYEGSAKPEWVWQSTGGSDAFEPKLSLVPLLLGTFKATLYAMVFSVPLALLAALYISQLGPRWLHGIVKPTIELMAAIPSVVVGFLAALWLAPRLETALFPTLLAAAALPLAVVLALGLWHLVPADVRYRLPEGSELVMLLAGGCLVVGAVALAAAPLEQALFGGDFTRWLFTDAHLRYDQRNALVVGLALGFAVIPVIFTLAEDAFSSVPPSLVNAARALGATRWQTAVRLVVPAASPGVFAAVMLGLGRAVGETMIVLMAAGNTPLLSLSPFNGMRTMSAAIAVEIPEAPVGGTLFRVLFLTGLLLFAFTMILTTLADVVGRRLRARYGRF